ncbi:hypothetical protein JCM6882_008499 [Rhodosporidiobolus microsporus]
MASTLPTEILAQILADPTLKRCDLAACCLVSRRVLPLAQEALFSHLTFDFAKNQDSAIDPALPTSKTAKLVGTLSFNPALSRLVRRLDLQYVRPTFGQERPVARFDMRAVYAGLLNLAALQLSLQGEDGPFAQVFLEANVKAPLRRLAVGNLMTPEVWQLLQRYQSTLRQLKVANSETFEYPWPRDRPTLTLPSLKLDGCDSPSPEFWTLGAYQKVPAALIGNSLPTLTHLHLTLPATTVPPLSSFPALTHLTLGLIGPDESLPYLTQLPYQRQVADLLAELRRCPSLLHLDFFESASVRQPRELSSFLCNPSPGPPPSPGLGRSLPPTLRVLQLQGVLFPPSAALAIVTSLPDSTGLRYLGFRPCLPRAPGRHRGIGAGGGGGPIERPREMDQLERECRERGIQLFEMAATRGERW